MAKKNPITEWMSKIGSAGGFARAGNLTPEQRSEAARKAVQVRWDKVAAARNGNGAKPKPVAKKKGRK